MRHAVVSQAEWLKARRVPLANENIFTKEGARPAQCCMPRVKVEKNYVLMARTVRNRSPSFSMSVAMSAKHGPLFVLRDDTHTFTLTPRDSAARNCRSHP